MSTQDDKRFEYFTLDFGSLLKEMVDKARSDVAEASPEDQDFQKGRLMGLYEALSLLHQQARGFDIPLEAVGLEDVGDPDLLLLPVRKHTE